MFQITASLAIGCGWLAWRRKVGRAWSPAAGPALLALGWLIQAGVEMQTVRNDGGRMNTVFKFWYQSWIVLAVGCAIVLTGELVSRRGLRRTAVVATAIAVVTTVGFWAVATPVRQDDRISGRGTSLDGEAYLRTGLLVGSDDTNFAPGDDLPLIDWLRANVSGIRPVAEAPGVDYRWTSRISWSTGLPTPIGWPYHETQQRRPYGASIETRVADMTALYTTTDEREIARVLARYSIAYVVYGTQEDLIASDENADALRRFECLSVMHETGRTTGEAADPQAYFVAEVDRPCVMDRRPLPTAPPPSS